MARIGKRKHPMEDPEREERIVMEIIVDAYDEEERAMGWYYYLENTITFPLYAVCDTEREISPLAEGERVKVLGLTGTEICKHEIFVRTTLSGQQTITIPLMQLSPEDETDNDSREAIEDWRYWMNMGYEF